MADSEVADSQEQQKMVLSDTEKAKAKEHIDLIMKIIGVIYIVFYIVYVLYYFFDIFGKWPWDDEWIRKPDDRHSFRHTEGYLNVGVYFENMIHITSLISFLLLYNLSQGAPYHETSDNIGVRNLILNTVGMLFCIYISYGIYVLVDKYKTITLSDTYKKIGDIATNTTEAFTSIGSSVYKNLEYNANKTEKKFCSDEVKNMELYNQIKVTPATVTELISFLKPFNLPFGIKIDLKKEIGKISEPIDSVTSVIKKTILALVYVIIMIINVITKIGLLFMHVIPASIISVSDFASLVRIHGIIPACFYTLSMMTSKPLVILLNAIFLFIPLSLFFYYFIYFIFSLGMSIRNYIFGILLNPGGNSAATIVILLAIIQSLIDSFNSPLQKQ